MKRKLMAIALSCAMTVSLLAGCGSTSAPSGAEGAAAPAAEEAPAADAAADAAATDSATPAAGGDGGVINLWAFTDEVPGMVDKYVEAHPDFPYTINSTIIATTDGAYQPALDQALQAGGDNQPDIYCAEAAFILKYSKGDMQDFAMPYKDLGIDIDAETATSKIAQYSMDIGSNTNGDIDALGYQATGGAFIYRRSIAKDVFGTDDPAEISKIIGGGSGSWSKFWEAAEKLAAKGNAIVSGDGDIWHAVENSSDKGWLDENGALQIDPKREEFLDISKDLTENGWSNQTQDWQDAWFADMHRL